ncbi:MAG: hypothetical protein ACKVS7_13215 [Gemmatimonadaceae bacterium]
MRRIRMLAFLVVALGGVSLALPERAEAAMAECYAGCWPYCPGEGAASAQCAANCPNSNGSWHCRSGQGGGQGGNPCGLDTVLVCNVNIT